MIDPSLGTDESRWEQWSAPRDWPRLDLALLAARTVVVLAAHPDDEVLGVGGVLSLLADAGTRLRVIWATDGEASHPGSTAIGRRDLARTRRAESRAGLVALGAGRASTVRLELPDGALAGCESDLVRRLRGVIGPLDVLLAPFAGDAHPDHEACGRAAREVSRTVLEYPVWAWHWASPGDDRIPWDRVHRVDLPVATRARKAAAVSCHGSQVRAVGPAPEDGPVLPEQVLAHFARDYEVVLT